MLNKINKFVKFKGDALEIGKDIAPRSRANLQTFLRWWWGGGGGGGGLVCASHRANTFALFIDVD